MQHLYLIVGASGSGKTTVAEAMEKACGYKSVSSMTTRHPRYDGEVGHEFVSQEQFDAVRDQLVAYTKIGNAEYGVTSDTLDACDLYVIDWPGVVALRERYHNKPLKIIMLSCPARVCAERMRARGDSEENIAARLAHDRKAFAIDPMEVDALICSTCSAERLAQNISGIIRCWER